VATPTKLFWTSTFEILANTLMVTLFSRPYGNQVLPANECQTLNNDQTWDKLQVFFISNPKLVGHIVRTDHMSNQFSALENVRCQEILTKYLRWKF
jgi:hypothetical protein